MKIAYRLKEDLEFIDKVQHATRTTKDFGFEPTHGMFGSDEWWQNIAAGELPVHTLKGRITDLYMVGTDDSPQSNFNMVSDAGEESGWAREFNSLEQDGLYRVGSRIEIDYLWQRYRPESWAKGAEIKQVLEIRIAEPEAL
jgi:hypothetical protein